MANSRKAMKMEHTIAVRVVSVSQCINYIKCNYDMQVLLPSAFMLKSSR